MYIFVNRCCRETAFCLHSDNPILPCPTNYYGVWVGYPVDRSDSSRRLSGLVIGFLLGMAKFIAGNIWSDPKCGEEDTRPGFAKMHFMFYGE